MTREIATIGFGQKGAERFVQLLVDAEVETLVDIRRRPDSALAGYARQRDLPFVLDRVAAIRYEHRLELAPPDELLERYRKDKDWTAYVRDFEAVLSSPEGVASMDALLDRPDRIALMCSEPTADRCHRRLVAERMSEMRPGVAIEHLV